MVDQPFSNVEALMEAMAQAPPESMGTLSPGVALEPGLRIGDYLLEGHLGKGGFADVWRARRGDGTEVAIKVLHESISSHASLVASFEQEVWTLARLEHPGVVGVLEHGQLKGQRPWYTMELLRGGVLNLRGYSLREALSLFEELLGVLAYIHARGLVHRDLKNENVFVLEDPDPRRLKLMDFGIAYVAQRMARDLPSQLANAGKEGNLIGTMTHMSPEQVLGQHRATGPATDLYAVGVMLYEVLTGHLPFVAKSPLQYTLLHLQVPPPGLGLEGALEPLETLVMRLLAKKYHHRHECAADVRRKLRAILENLPEETQQVPLHMPSAAQFTEHSAAPSGLEDTVDSASETMMAPSIEPKASGLEHTVAEGTPWATVETAFELNPSTFKPTEALMARHGFATNRGAWELLRVRELPLVGREELCASLWESMKAVARGKGPCAALLMGASGMGKQGAVRWLVHTALERGRARVLHLDLSARPQLDAVMHQALYRILRQPREEVHFVRERIQEVLSFSNPEETEALVSFLCNQLEGASLHEGGRRPLEPLWPVWGKALFQLISYPTPKPLIVWVDGRPSHSALDVLDWLAWLLAEAEAGQHPVLVLWGLAPDWLSGASAQRLHTLLQQPQVTMHRLDPLEIEHQRALLNLLEPELDPESAARFIESCQGNPYWLREALFGCWSMGELVREDGQVRLVNPGPPPIPTDVLGALRNRLEVFWTRTDDPLVAAKAWRLLALLGGNFSREQVEACLQGTGWTPEFLVECAWLELQEVTQRPRYAFRDQELRAVLLKQIEHDTLVNEFVPVCVELRLLESLRLLGRAHWEGANHELNAALNLLVEYPPAESAHWRFFVLDAMARVAYRQRQALVLGGFATLLAAKSPTQEPWNARSDVAAQLWRGCVALLEGELEQAEAHLERASDAPRGASDVSSAQALVRWSEIAIRRRDFANARIYLDMALVRIREARNVESRIVERYQVRLLLLLEADILRSQGELAQQMGDHTASQNPLDLALEVYTRGGDLQGQVRAQILLMRMWRIRLTQEPEEVSAQHVAHQHLSQVERLLEQLDDPRGQALKAWEAGSLSEVTGDLENARMFYYQARAHYRDCGEVFDEGLVCNILGELYRQQATAEARSRALEFFAHFRQAMKGAPYYESIALGSMGWTALEGGDYALAQAHFVDALALLRPHNEKSHVETTIMALVGAGASAGLQGDREEAHQHLDDAWSWASGQKRILGDEVNAMRDALEALLELDRQKQVAQPQLQLLIKRLLGALAIE